MGRKPSQVFPQTNPGRTDETTEHDHAQDTTQEITNEIPISTNPTYEYEPIENPAKKDITAPPQEEKRNSTKPKRYGFSQSNYTSTTNMCINDLLNVDTETLINLSQLKWFKLPPSKCNRAESEDCSPRSYNEIQYLENSSEWYRAIDEEIAQLIEFNTWKLVPLPEGRRAIGSVWVFRIKRNQNKTITRYKARLCAQGFSLIAGIDYREIFSPVFRMESFRIFLVIVGYKPPNIPKNNKKVI